MTIQDYFNWKAQKQTDKNISMICLKQRHKEISKKISGMLIKRK